MAPAATAGLLIGGPIILGAILGIIELSFVHADERGMGWLGHGLHAIPTMMLFIFVSMNLNWALGKIGYPEANLNVWVVVGLRVLIGLIAAIKIGGAAAIAGRIGEKFYHSAIIGALVAVAPYVWLTNPGLGLGNIIKPFVPANLQGWV
jgi:hypothetical protein